MSNLLLGAAVGLRAADVRVFVDSFRRFNPQDTICFLYSDLPADAISFLQSRRVELVRYKPIRFWHGPIHAARIKQFLHLVKAAAGDCEKVLFSDVRDVLFQGDAFAAMDAGRCHVFLERDNTPIETERFNARWVKYFVPKDLRKALLPAQVSCVGVVGGGRLPVQKYLEKLAALIDGVSLLRRRKIGADQALHNLIVHSGLVDDLAIHRNNDIVATMALEPRSFYQWDPSQGITLASGQRPVVFHQYDRNRPLAAKVREAYGVAQPEPAK